MKTATKNDLSPPAAGSAPSSPRPDSYAWFKSAYSRLDAERDVLQKRIATLEALAKANSEALAERDAALSGLQRLVADATHRAEMAEARVAELEPLAEVGSRMEAMPRAQSLRRALKKEGFYVERMGMDGPVMPSPLAALRAAGIGEEQP